MQTYEVFAKAALEAAERAPGVSGMRGVRPPMPSAAPWPLDQYAPLSPFVIRKLAGRKGLLVASVQKGVRGRRTVTVTDPGGSPVDNPPGQFWFNRRGKTLPRAVAGPLASGRPIEVEDQRTVPVLVRRRDGDGCSDLQERPES